MRQKATSADEELADLQKKYAVLEGDRKAYYETSQWTIKQNRDTIAAAKRENKELRTQLALLHEQKGIKHGTAPGLDPARADLRRLALFVADLRKRHDDMHQQVFRKGGLMQKQLSETKALELDAEGITEDDTPIRQHIRMLENRLDKALVKYNEAQSIRKTYEQIVKRLREERVSFDNQLAAIGRTLKAKEHDLDELVLMSHDANHAKEVAKAELARVDAQLLQERLAREKDLADRRAQARAKQEMSARMDMRARTPKDAMDDDELLESGDHKRDLDSAEDGGRREEEMRRVMTFEEAFRKMKDATGVSDVNEVIQKFLTQEETTANLKQLTREAQARIDLLSTETNSAKSQIEEVKYSGSSTLGSRRIVDEYEVKLLEANLNCERLRQRYERVARVLINLKAGAEHLVDKLEVVKIDQVTIPLNDDTIVDVFGQCEFKLLRTLEAFKSDDEVQRMLDDADAMGLFAQQDMRGGDIHLQNNIRIPSALSDAAPGENEEEEEDYYSDEDDDDDKEVPDRLFVKSASVQVLERATKRAKRKNNRFSTIARSENNTPQASPAGINAQTSAFHNVKGKPIHGKKADPE